MAANLHAMRSWQHTQAQHCHILISLVLQAGISLTCLAQQQASPLLRLETYIVDKEFNQYLKTMVIHA
jgi:hypothetical protein